MSQAPPRPTPPTQGLAGEFFAHCAEGRLCFQRCSACGSWRHLPRLVCARCQSPDWEWRASSGRGRIHSWTVSHRTLVPAFADALPLAIVVVELEEGVRMVSGIREMSVEDLALDLPVEVVFEPVSGAAQLPYFRPRTTPERRAGVPR